MYPDDEEKRDRWYKRLIKEYKDIIVHLQATKKDEYFWRVKLPRTQTEIENVMRGVDMVVQDMHDHRSYPSPNPIKCVRCAFREVCALRRKGADYLSILESEFMPRTPFDSDAGTDRGDKR